MWQVTVHTFRGGTGILPVGDGRHGLEARATLLWTLRTQRERLLWQRRRWISAAWALVLAVVGAASAKAAPSDPLTLSAVQDTTIRPDRRGVPPQWIAREKDVMIYGPKNGAPNFRALFRFDLTSVPKTPVRAAVLKLTFYKCWSARKTRQDILRLHRIVRPWEEAGASWTNSLKHDEWINPGGDFDPRPIAGAYVLDAHTGESKGKTIGFNVTVLVQAWQSGRIPNYGLILLNTDNDSKTTARPFSREAKSPAVRPKLILYWARPPKPDPNWIKPSVLKPYGRPVRMRVRFNTKNLNQARVGVAYKAQLQAKGGLAPYAFKVRTGLPEGVKLTPEGLLQGVPKKAGRYPLSISISDASRHSASGQIELVVAEALRKDPLAAGPGGKKPKAKSKSKKPAEEEEEE